MKINDYSIYGTMGLTLCVEVQKHVQWTMMKISLRVCFIIKWLEYIVIECRVSTSVEVRIIWDGTKCEVLDFRDWRAIGETILIQDKALTRTQWNKLLEDMQE